MRALVGGPELVDAYHAAAHLPGQLLADAEGAASALRQTDEAVKAAAGELGWWGTYIKTVEDGIFALHDKLESVGAPFPYGLSIFCFVLGVKIVTLPLNWNQLSSAAQMKSIKPQQDLVNEWYQDNKQMQNMAISDLFENLNVNPLAGCLPSLAQIPVFLGVYYSVTSIAKAQVFTEGFLWIPNLSGPIADRREGISWLTEGWVDGVPRLGWEDTLAYLSIPAILVCTQTAALYLLGRSAASPPRPRRVPASPPAGHAPQRVAGAPTLSSGCVPPCGNRHGHGPSPRPVRLSFDAIDENKKETASVALVLKFLPWMLGWFAINAPSGLGLYWVFNNILTTTTTVLVKKVHAAGPLFTPLAVPPSSTPPPATIHAASPRSPAPPALPRHPLSRATRLSRPVVQAVERDELSVAVDLAALGPRREPLPMASELAQDWVEAVAEGKVGSKETSVDVEA